MCHSGSTYWRKKESEKAEMFLKTDPYLTFLNVYQLERQGAYIQTKVEELEGLNQSLRQRDKVKEYAVAHLSDQLVALTARMQEVEKKKINELFLCKFFHVYNHIILTIWRNYTTGDYNCNSGHLNTKYAPLLLIILTCYKASNTCARYCSFIRMIGTGGYITLGLKLDDEDELTASKTKSTSHLLHHFIACKNYDMTVTRTHLQRYISILTSNQYDMKDQHRTRRRSARLMLVDDDQDISFLFKIVLAGEGYIVDSFNNPFEALQKFENRLYDLVIIDIVMPKMNGFMLYDEIRKLDAKVRVCFLTAAEMTYYEEIKKDAFPELDAKNCFIRKPIENEELIRQVREILNSAED